MKCDCVEKREVNADLKNPKDLIFYSAKFSLEWGDSEGVE